MKVKIVYLITTILVFIGEFLLAITLGSSSVCGCPDHPGCIDGCYGILHPALWLPVVIKRGTNELLGGIFRPNPFISLTAFEWLLSGTYWLLVSIVLSGIGLKVVLWYLQKKQQ